MLGTGIDHGYFKATGKFRRGGKAVKGNVRFAFKTTHGRRLRHRQAALDALEA